MAAIGRRELRQHASRYLERVARGESIDVTDRGRLVARIVPVTGDPWADLLAAGRVRRPEGEGDVLSKLVRPEDESATLRRFLRRHRSDERASSDLARVEVVRAVSTGGQDAVRLARRQLGRLHLMPLYVMLLEDAATLANGLRVRSLDAIHLAAAHLLSADLGAVITYDNRMAATAAAAALGLPVESPA